MALQLASSISAELDADGCSCRPPVVDQACSRRHAPSSCEAVCRKQVTCPKARTVGAIAQASQEHADGGSEHISNSVRLRGHGDGSSSCSIATNSSKADSPGRQSAYGATAFQSGTVTAPQPVSIMPGKPPREIAACLLYHLSLGMFCLSLGMFYAFSLYCHCP